MLAEADSLATGPGVWGDWKATLIGDLVRRCRAMMAGEPEPEPEPVSEVHLSLARDGAVHVELVAGESPHTFAVTMIAPDRRGLLSKAAGVLALNALSVHSASVNSADGSAINTFVVSPHFGSPPAAELLRQQFILALNGELDAVGSLQKRDRETAQFGTERAGQPKPAVPAADRLRRASCGTSPIRTAGNWSRCGPATAPVCLPYVPSYFNYQHHRG